VPASPENPSLKVTDFPSDSISKFVLEKARTDAEEGGEKFTGDLEGARRHIRIAVFDLFRALGQSLRSHEPSEQGFPLSESERFSPPVAEALLARISVPYYKSFEFLDKLHGELLEVAPLAGQGWTLKRSAPNALEVRASDARLRSRIPDTSRKKAQVARFGAAD
jgi:hypothetical protein